MRLLVFLMLCSCGPASQDIQEEAQCTVVSDMLCCRIKGNSASIGCTPLQSIIQEAINRSSK